MPWSIASAGGKETNPIGGAPHGFERLTAGVHAGVGSRESRRRTVDVVDPTMGLPQGVLVRQRNTGPEVSAVQRKPHALRKIAVGGGFGSPGSALHTEAHLHACGEQTEGRCVGKCVVGWERGTKAGIPTMDWENPTPRMYQMGAGGDVEGFRSNPSWRGAYKAGRSPE